MISIYQILKITIIIFNIIPLYNCINETNKFDSAMCVDNTIIKVSQSDILAMEDHPELITVKVNENYKNILKILKNKLNWNVQDTRIKQKGNSKNKKDQDISRVIQTGIQKITQKFNYYSEGDYPMYFDNSFKNVDLELEIKETTFRAILPECFLSLRMLYNTVQEFNKSFMASSLIEVKNTGKEKYKSFYTSDYKYIVQPISKIELEFLSSMLFEYFSHFCKFSKTLLPKYSGLYYIKHESIKYYIVVLKTFFPINLKKSLKTKYFLNGSNRIPSINDKNTILNYILFDKDFTFHYPEGLKLKSHEHTKLVKNLENDTKFLAKCNIIGYNLVLITYNFYHNVNVESEYAKIISNPNQQNGPTVIKYNNRYMFIHYGIIDTLHTYTFTKDIEHAFSCMLGETVRNSIEYQKRFMTFITRNIFRSDQNV